MSKSNTCFIHTNIVNYLNGKIDTYQIDHIIDGYEVLLIIKSIILMAKGLGLSTIAECVETIEQ